MERGRVGLCGRLAAMGAVVVLAFVLVGDRGVAATVPAPMYGQDPLEILDLKVRPNVILVLDSSGTMTLTDDGPSWNENDTRSSDHPRSRLGQAKPVLRQIVKNNQDKVSFMFGMYTGAGLTFVGQGAGYNRFQYTVNRVPATELTVRRALGDSSSCYDRGLQSWQIIYPEWGTLYYGEDNAGTTVVCRASLSSVTSLPKFYAQGNDLATDIQNAMNAATCSGGSRANTYKVSYDAGSCNSAREGTFTFQRVWPNATRSFQIRWADTPNSIRGALGSRTAGNTGMTDWVRSGRPYTLLYRKRADDVTESMSTTGSLDPVNPFTAPSGLSSCTGFSGCGVDTKFVVRDNIGGVDNYFYNLGAGRLWNGETIKVDRNGTICGMDFATAKTSPARITVEGYDSCTSGPIGSAVFEFSGTGDMAQPYGSNECNGFRMKSALTPCDLQSPPAPSQFELIRPYVDSTLPLNAPGDVDGSGNPLPVGEPRDFTTNGPNGAWGSADYGKPDGIPDYVEVRDGSWQVDPNAQLPYPGTQHNSYTPIANSLIDIKGLPDATNKCVVTEDPPPGTPDSFAAPPKTGACVRRGFAKLWYDGQTGSTSPAGPFPWKLDAIKDHKNPKERTIVVFVTDGLDSCGSRGDAADYASERLNALRAAYHAERLYTPLDVNETASSVSTYVIGYANSAIADRLNWIAWGGSGLGQGLPGQPDVDTEGSDCESSPGARPVTGAGTTSDCRWNESSAVARRAQCTTCVDAFMAPTADALASTIQGLIDQNVQEGEFGAGRSITETVFEYADLAGDPGQFSAADPKTRYQGIVPTTFLSGFSLPGFRGELKAYQGDRTDTTGTVVVQKWGGVGAGVKLNNLVRFGDANAASCPATAAVCNCLNSKIGGALGECTFEDLSGGLQSGGVAGDAAALSAARLKRRIFTTSRNGVYYSDFSTLAQKLVSSDPLGRIRLWPPETNLIPAPSSTTNASYGSMSILDLPFGLPLDSAANPAAEFTKLQTGFWACLGTNLPSPCTNSDPLVKMKAARREAREIALAHLAGAKPVASGSGWKRASDNRILYTYKDWVLADSSASAAVLTYPVAAEPGVFAQEYKKYRDGVGDNTQGLRQSRAGFGLRNPDDGVTAANAYLEPMMTVVYTPSNDMLHAFRAGPCYSPSTSTSAACVTGDREHGGEELWGFLPYDQLNVATLGFVHRTQVRENRIYAMAAAIRFSDVFVPGSASYGSGLYTTTNGVWRRLLLFGRGIGGKHVTALDVTGIGPYTLRARDAGAPIPLWSRGNPDTQNGLAAGTKSGYGGDADTDYAAYARMGQTWSVPVVGYVDAGTNKAVYGTARRPDPAPQWVLFMGSGYGATSGCASGGTPCEGRTFYTLDALSGDVIAAVDVGDRLTASVPNAIVASPAGFNPKTFTPLKSVHPAVNTLTRLYVGDVSGRVWKFLTYDPTKAIPFADLGATQPVGTPAALLGMGADPDNPDYNLVPHVYVSSGNDRRFADGPFKLFGFKDSGGDTETSTTGTVTFTDGKTVAYTPAETLFADEYAEGDPTGESCGAGFERGPFRGTVQPATLFECGSIVNGVCVERLGRVIFGGTRVGPAVTPLACSGAGEYPCRSVYDSILYALGARTGTAAYSTGGDSFAYKIYRDSRIQAVGMVADPTVGGGGSRLGMDEGRIKGLPKPPPPPGISPTYKSAVASVTMLREPGQPPPAVRYGSTVCQ